MPHGHPSSVNPVKQAHPDWLLRCWWWQGLWNLASPAFRRHKIAVLRELAEQYEWDGFEIDFARHTPFLPPGRQWELRGHATAFVRGVREMLLVVAAARPGGAPILLAAKVPEDLAGCRCVVVRRTATWGTARPVYVAAC